MLDLAIEIANNTHRGQTDRGGQPYILHPLRVMINVEKTAWAYAPWASRFMQDEPAALDALRCVAVLHDVVEDAEDPTQATRLIQMGFDPNIANAVDLLSRRSYTGENKGDEGREDYDAYIDRLIAGDSLMAKLVKLTDLADNSDMTRLPKPTKADWDRWYKYLLATKKVERSVRHEPERKTL